MDAWLTLDEAEGYFATRLGADRFWCSGVNKAAALATAQQNIQSSPDYLFMVPTSQEMVSYWGSPFPDATYVPISPATDAMKNAVCEQALFLLGDADIDVRASLQVQGVQQIGIVRDMQEQFVGGRPQTVRICVSAADLLIPYLDPKKNVLDISV